jgi:hypothetical protein
VRFLLLGPIFGAFWVLFGEIFERFWAVFEFLNWVAHVQIAIFGHFWVNLGQKGSKERFLRFLRGFRTGVKVAFSGGTPQKWVFGLQVVHFSVTKNEQKSKLVQNTLF